MKIAITLMLLCVLAFPVSAGSQLETAKKEVQKLAENNIIHYFGKIEGEDVFIILYRPKSKEKRGKIEDFQVKMGPANALKEMSIEIRLDFEDKLGLDTKFGKEGKVFYFPRDKTKQGILTTNYLPKTIMPVDIDK
jgi:hypothetical protein